MDTDDRHDDPLDLPSPARGASRSVLQVFWERRWVVALGLAVGLVGAGLAYSRRPPLYRSTAQVVVVKKEGATAALAPGVDSRTAVMEDYVSTHLVVIRSPYIVEKAIQKRQLAALRSFQGGDPAAAILAGLSATRDQGKDAPAGPGGNNIINLAFTGPDPADCQTVLAAVIDAYRDFLDEKYKTTSDATFGLIQQAATAIAEDQKRHQEEHQKARADSPVIVAGPNGEPLHKLQIARYKADEDRLAEEAAGLTTRIVEIEKALREKTDRPEVVLRLAVRVYDRGLPNSTAAESGLQAALFPLLQEKAKLATAYGPGHADMKQLDQRIEMVKQFHKQMDQLSRAGLGWDAVEAALLVLRGELRLARTNLATATKLREDAVAYARKVEDVVERDRALTNKGIQLGRLYDETLTKLTQINLVRGHGGFDAWPIAKPEVGFKVAPVLTQFLLLGLAGGLALGAGGAWLLDRADTSFRTPEEVRRRLGLPIVGHVPFAAGGAAPAGALAELDPGLVSVHRPTSPEAEAYRGVRTALYFNTHGGRHTVLQVTSPNMGDGKTTLAANLAVSIAQSGRRVLLVDADLRRPRVHRMFAVPGKVGLADVIAGEGEAEAVVQPTAVPNLSVLPCGRRPANPAELLTSPRLEDVLDDLRRAFDFVIVDTPPLLAVSDPCAVAPRVDGVILTIRASKNGRPAAERARDLLAGLKANCIGVVVNGVGRHGTMSGYGYDHYKYADGYAADYTPTDADADADPVGPPVNRP